MFRLRLVAFFLAFSWASASARSAYMQPMGSSQGPVDIEVLHPDGTPLAHWNNIEASPGVPALVDPLPSSLRLRWRFRYGPWESRSESIAPVLGQQPLEDTLRLQLLITDSRCCVVSRKQRYPLPVEPPWEFQALPLLSLRAGSPGLVGIQVGAGAGIGKRSLGSQGGSEAFLLASSLEADLHAPSWRIGISYVGFGNAAAASWAINTACRFSPWGESGPIDCGPELDLMFSLFHARIGFLTTSGRATAGIGLGL